MRTFSHAFRYRQGHAGGIITGIMCELPAGDSVTMSWPRLPLSWGVCAAQHTLKTKLQSAAGHSRAQHSTGLGVVGLTVWWITDSSVHKALPVSITTDYHTCGVLLMIRKWNATDDQWNIWSFVRKTPGNHSSHVLHRTDVCSSLRWGLSFIVSLTSNQTRGHCCGWGFCVLILPKWQICSLMFVSPLQDLLLTQRIQTSVRSPGLTK